MVLITICAEAQIENIQFQSTSHDFGEIKYTVVEYGPNSKGKELTCSFKLKNSGEETVTIKQVIATTGAITCDYSYEPILPNEQREIVVHFNTKSTEGSMIHDNEMIRKFKKSLTVSFGSSLKRLYIQGTINISSSEKIKMTEDNHTVWYRVSRNNRIGVTDINSVEIVPIKYDKVWYHRAGFLVHEGKSMGFYNENGKYVIPTQRGYKRIDKTNVSDKLNFRGFNDCINCNTCYAFWKDGLAGLCEENGREVLTFPDDVANPIEAETEEIIPCYVMGKFFIIRKFILRNSLFYKIVDGHGNKIFDFSSTIPPSGTDLNSQTLTFKYLDAEKHSFVDYKELSNIKTTKNPFATYSNPKTSLSTYAVFHGTRVGKVYHLPEDSRDDYDLFFQCNVSVYGIKGEQVTLTVYVDGPTRGKGLYAPNGRHKTSEGNVAICGSVNGRADSDNTRWPQYTLTLPFSDLCLPDGTHTINVRWFAQSGGKFIGNSEFQTIHFTKHGKEITNFYVDGGNATSGF